MNRTACGVLCKLDTFQNFARFPQDFSSNVLDALGLEEMLENPDAIEDEFLVRMRSQEPISERRSVQGVKSSQEARGIDCATSGRRKNSSTAR